MRAAARLGVTVELPDGRLLVKPPRIDASAPAAPVMRLYRPAQFFRRLGHDGLIGFGESYMAGDWDADDVASVLTPFARRMARLVPGGLQRARRWYDARQPASEHNDLRGSKSNISRHYDLSNELFALFLDRTMTYSSAIWDDATPAETDDSPRDDVLDFKPVQPHYADSEPHHQHEKPLDLMRHFIGKHTYEGEVVIEPFGGTGPASCGTYACIATVGALPIGSTCIGTAIGIGGGVVAGARRGGGGNAASAPATSRIGVPRVSPAFNSVASGETEPSASFFAISARMKGPCSSPEGSTMK